MSVATPPVEPRLRQAAWVRLARLASRTSTIGRLLRSVGDGWLLGLALMLAAGGLAPVATVYVTREVVDHLVLAAGAQGGSGAVRSLLFWAALGALILLASHLLNTVTAWLRAAYIERLQDDITARVHEQSARLDLAFYESPEFFDRLHRARAEASYRPAALVGTCSDVFQGAITLVAMAAVLTTFGLWLPVGLFVGALPVLYVVARHGLLEQQWRRERTADERRTWYYDSVLTSTAHAAELRLFGLGDFFRHAHADLRRKLRTEWLQLVHRRSVAELGAGAGGVTVAGAAFAWMVWRTVSGVVTLGQLAAFYQAFSQGLATTRSLLSGVGQLYANSVFLDNLFEYLALEPRIVSPASPVATPGRVGGGIRFRDVTFRYPDAGRPALEHFNLYVPAGRTVAIVGPNGAGKSTLIKLLCRLYDPVEGAVEIDDVDVRAFDVAELRRLVAVLFQEPVRYSQSVADNVRMGSLPAGGHVRACLDDVTLARVRAASAAAGADTLIESLPHGYDTLLGRWFDQGTELSTGEWQRIALARTLLRPSPIVVLDEPTSALDPWAEADWYRRFRDAARGRTSIIVTHRFTTAMQADLIHVMERGAIVESGSHQELLASGGRYARSWNGQARPSWPATCDVEAAV